MEIKVTKLTDVALLKKAFNSTVRFNSNVDLLNAYRLMHSPIRTQEFFIEMLDIPTFVSVHFVRHKIGCEHFVLTNRDDRGGVKADRDTPVNHSMKINAESLITLARKRLCFKSHRKTVQVMSLIKNKLKEIDPDLVKFMVPECVFRNGLCSEGRFTCGKKQRILNKYSYYKEIFDEQL